MTVEDRNIGTVVCIYQPEAQGQRVYPTSQATFIGQNGAHGYHDSFIIQCINFYKQIQQSAVQNLWLC